MSGSSCTGFLVGRSRLPSPPVSVRLQGCNNVVTMLFGNVSRLHVSCLGCSYDYKVVTRLSGVSNNKTTIKVVARLFW